MMFYERYISLKHRSRIYRNRQRNVVPSTFTVASTIEALADTYSHWFNINQVSVVYSFNSMVVLFVRIEDHREDSSMIIHNNNKKNSVEKRLIDFETDNFDPTKRQYHQ